MKRALVRLIVIVGVTVGAVAFILGVLSCAQGFAIVEMKPVDNHKLVAYRVSDTVTFLSPWVLLPGQDRAVEYVKNSAACGVMTDGLPPDTRWYVTADASKGAKQTVRSRSFENLAKAKAFVEKVCRGGE